ncbi:MAG: signal peptidase I [Nocardioides sp.]|nr:signal peptidase I [Nocardioides sp.]
MPDAAPEEPTKRKLPLWLETVLLLTIAVLMALVIKTFLVQAFYIPSASMKPGLVENDRILVQKVSYWFGDSPDRGDVVVFEDPGGWLAGLAPEPANPMVKVLARIGLYPSGGHLVKRVIGVAGDEIVCCDSEGRISVNGVALDEDDFIKPQPKCDGPMAGCDWTVEAVPEGSLFVMGDNRNQSADSSDRLCVKAGPSCDPDAAYVAIDLVVGKVFALVWPFGRAELVGRPEVFDDVPDAVE